MRSRNTRWIFLIVLSVVSIYLNIFFLRTVDFSGNFSVEKEILEITELRGEEKLSPKLETRHDDIDYTIAGDDSKCPFHNSSLYRSIYVYPLPHEAEFKGDILSHRLLNATIFPWVTIDQRTKANGSNHYHPYSMHAQFSTELIVRDIVHSCLRTHDPEHAKLFYVPYLPSVEFHAGQNGPPPSFATSIYAQAIMDATEGNYELWETVFGLTSKYWKRKKGADHILVFSEPLQGFTHPKGKRGNYHYIHTQKQLRPPIVISVELSTTFVQMYPKCSAKNILVPYPITDGTYYNGKLKERALAFLANASFDLSEYQLPQEREFHDPASVGQRAFAHWYKASAHGACVDLRHALQANYRCSATKMIHKKLGYTYAEGMTLSTFTPCPAGDTPSAKRMFDAVLTGTIPIVISHDFVWPFSDEMDSRDSLLKASDFSLRWPASEFSEPKFDKKCNPLNGSTVSVEERIARIPASEIERLRSNLKRAAHHYAYYAFDESTSDNLLRQGYTPNGGAAIALVEALARRARENRWDECEKELASLGSARDIESFKC